MIRSSFRLTMLAIALVACGKGDTPPPPSSNIGLTQETGPRGRGTDPDASAEAERMFLTVCAACHGTEGTGRGPASEMLKGKPRDYTDAKWQASVTDADIKKIIVLGGAAIGKSPDMPPNPPLKDKAEVLDGLVKIIRAFGIKKQ